MVERDPVKIALAVGLSILATGIGIYNLHEYLKTVSSGIKEIQERVNNGNNESQL